MKLEDSNFPLDINLLSGHLQESGHSHSTYMQRKAEMYCSVVINRMYGIT